MYSLRKGRSFIKPKNYAIENVEVIPVKRGDKVNGVKEK